MAISKKIQIDKDGNRFVVTNLSDISIEECVKRYNMKWANINRHFTKNSK